MSHDLSHATLCACLSYYLKGLGKRNKQKKTYINKVKATEIEAKAIENKTIAEKNKAKANEIKACFVVKQ